jgi:GNAT superfamily N-acetyltransferase
MGWPTGGASTSIELVEIIAVAYDHPDAARLIEEILRDDVDRYGGADAAPVEPAEFAPPHGLFLIGYVDGVAVASGGWRSHGADAELKRMYVVPAARGRGRARRMLAELERTASAAGHRRLILETGNKNAEALRLYRSCGYVEVPAFGFYADDPVSIHLGKIL